MKNKRIKHKKIKHDSKTMKGMIKNVTNDQQWDDCKDDQIMNTYKSCITSPIHRVE